MYVKKTDIKIQMPCLHKISHEGTYLGRFQVSRQDQFVRGGLPASLQAWYRQAAAPDHRSTVLGEEAELEPHPVEFRTTPVSRGS
jgi:hypothetical protein